MAIHEPREKPGRRRAPRPGAKLPLLPLPVDWTPPPDLYAWAAERHGFDRRRVDSELELFRDHHGAHGSTMADWTAAARTWLGKARGFERRPLISTSPQQVPLSPARRAETLQVPAEPLLLPIAPPRATGTSQPTGRRPRTGTETER